MSDFTFSIERVEPQQIVGTGDFLAGAAERDITPPLGLPMAGYSASGKIAEGIWGRLFVRALVVQDGGGARACLCVCDLMSGTRPLLERVAQRTAATAGISVDRLILAGTHTHNGPGGIYGNSLYDTFAQRLDCAGYEPDLVDWLATEIALAVEEAAERLEPAAVASGFETLWRESKNRSLGAFCHDTWSDPGSGTPAEDAEGSAGGPLEPSQRAIDPRVRVLAAYRRPEGTPIAVFGFFGCHYHATRPGTRLYTPDLAGGAVRQARWRLESQSGSGPVIVAVGASCGADVHTMRTDLPDFQRRGRALARRVGFALGEKVAAAARSLAASARVGEVSVRYVEPEHSQPAPGNGDPPRLSGKWLFGVPVLSGSEETPTFLVDLGLKEGDRGKEFPKKHPQYPKKSALGPFQKLIAGIEDLEPCRVYPLHQLRIGDLVLATVPGEVTAVGGFELETAIRQAAGVSTVMIVAYAGDYGGYFTTEAQYRKQHYEGASTLYGRHALRYLQAFHVAMAGSPPGPTPAGTVEFRTRRGNPRFSPHQITFATPDADPRLAPRPKKHRATVRWRMHQDTHLVLSSGGPLVRIEEETGGAWQPVEHKGRALDDYWHAMRIQRQPGGTLWQATLDVPDELLGRTLRFRILTRGAFPGATSGPFSIPA